MTIQELFGERCKELRKQTKLSQEKFALKINMDRTYYASVEMGKRNISLENMEKIITTQLSLSKQSIFVNILLWL